MRGNDQAVTRGKQTRRETLRLLAAGAMGGFSHAAARSAAPNIIFILTDDLGWTELGCFGNRFNHTPNLDRLALDGVRFSSAYAAAPVCSPTRASIMTGLYPVRVGITDYLRGDDPRSQPRPPHPAEALARGWAQDGPDRQVAPDGRLRATKGRPRVARF